MQLKQGRCLDVFTVASCHAVRIRWRLACTTDVCKAPGASGS